MRPGQTGHGRTDSMVDGEGEMDAVERALTTDELRVGCKGSETGRDGKHSRGTRGPPPSMAHARTHRLGGKT
eukprot:1670873-Rhodomonas_salina.1